jgi:hypothetical protein
VFREVLDKGVVDRGDHVSFQYLQLIKIALVIKIDSVGEIRDKVIGPQISTKGTHQTDEGFVLVFDREMHYLRSGLSD